MIQRSTMSRSLRIEYEGVMARRKGVASFMEGNVYIVTSDEVYDTTILMKTESRTGRSR
jgi:hypothetical protein